MESTVQKIVRSKKRIKPYFMLLLAAFLIEVLFFNISAWRSLGNHPSDQTKAFSIDGAVLNPSTNTYQAKSDEVILYAGNLNQDIRSLYFGIDFSDPEVQYEIQITDDGNSVVPYALTSQYILQWQNSSHYMTIHPYGRVRTMKLIFHVTPGSTFSLRQISINPIRPFYIRGLRVLVMFLLFGFLTLFRKKSRIHEIAFEGKDSRKILFAAGFLIVGVLTVSLMTLKCGKTWKTNSYCTEYADLAHSLARGSFKLDYKVSEELKKLPNPYDYSLRMQSGGDTNWDTAYYHGAYYCYFGIVPVLTTYLPYYMLTGHDLNNIWVAWIFSVMIFLSCAWLVYEMIRRWFPKVPFYIWPIFSILTGFSVNFVYLYQRADIYNIPILAGNAFALTGLSCWLHGLNLFESTETNIKKSRSQSISLWLSLGAVCMALVAGCRPHMVLISFLAIPLFGEMLIMKRELFSKKSILRTLLFCAPYACVAGFLMYYNYARFGSPLDFGAAYNLTTNDMTRREFNLDRLGCGLYTYLLQPPALIGVFPFVQKCVVASLYMGKNIIENLYGGIFSIDLISGFTFVYFYAKHLMDKKQIRMLFWFSTLIGVLLCFIDASVSGILQRYSADFSILFIIPGCLIAGSVLTHLWKKRNRTYDLMAAVLCVITVFLVAYNAMMICTQLGDGTIQKDSMTAFYQLRSYFILQ